MEENCIFCKIIKNQIPSTKVYESENFIGILDINPKSEGHTIIIPKKHFKDNILGMPSTLGTELLDAIKEISLNLIKEKKADGFNIIVNNGKSAGQIIFHTHIHIVPRKENDGLKSLV